MLNRHAATGEFAPADSAPPTASGRGMDDYIEGLIAAAATPPTLEDRLSRVECGRDFTFAGLRFLAKIVDFYDGDTVRVAFEFGGQVIQYRARMVGYDSPEMKPPKSNPNREAEKASAKAAAAALAAKVSGELVYIECGEFDKYGRILTTVYLRDGAQNGENVNRWMVSNGHGVPYSGGKKSPFGAAAHPSG